MISVNNAGLKPWGARSYDLSLESYQIKDGVGSIGVFQKEIEDFFTSVTTAATPELLEPYGLESDQSLLTYNITRLANGGDAKIKGMEFSYRQALTLLPSWARGFQIFAATLMRLLRLPFVLPVLFVLFLPIHAALPPAEQIDVFTSGTDGYHTYRIPSLIRAKNGALLAFCEGRKSGGGDSGDIDLLLKRSTDGGRTWGPQQVVWDDAANTCGNPCPVLDESTGTIWLLLTHNLGTDRERDIAARTAKGTRTVWVASSADHGVTWARPVEITAAAKLPEWTWYATGPGVGIQLKTGPHTGRLVIPCDHNYDDPATKQHLSGSHTIYSDDRGRTWKLGGVIRPKVNECQIVELSDGRLLMNMRSNHGRNLRAHALSNDGGRTWSAPFDAAALIEPVCQASLIRHEAGVLLFSNPAAKTRVNMLVRTSADEGRTWSDLVQLNAGPSAYSSLVSLSGSEAGCLYERGVQRAYEKITFVRFPTR